MMAIHLGQLNLSCSVRRKLAVWAVNHPQPFSSLPVLSFTVSSYTSLRNLHEDFDNLDAPDAVDIRVIAFPISLPKLADVASDVT